MNFFPENEIAKTHSSVNELSRPWHEAIFGWHALRRA
jgi:hypothetical protein